MKSLRKCKDNDHTCLFQCINIETVEPCTMHSSMYKNLGLLVILATTRINVYE